VERVDINISSDHYWKSSDLNLCHNVNHLRNSIVRLSFVFRGVDHALF
jgi:hypothetical protein